MSDISARDLYAAYVKTCRTLGIEYRPWEELSEQQRAGLAERAREWNENERAYHERMREWNEQMRQLDHKKRRLRLLEEEFLLEEK